MKEPRRSSLPPVDTPVLGEAEKWWDTDELVTLVDAVSISGLDEPSLEVLVAAGKIAAIEISGIRYYRLHDLRLYAIPK